LDAPEKISIERILVARGRGNCGGFHKPSLNSEGSPRMQTTPLVQICNCAILRRRRGAFFPWSLRPRFA
jgi:hypothetical protein